MLCLAFAGTITGATSRPNILYLYADDLGWGALGPNGQWERREQGLPAIQTPNLDRLARAGVNFTRAYGCTVCSPARSSQQSGFHQGHTFADRNDPDNAKKAMRTEDVLIGDVLSAAGYATGYWGKWGYGGSKDRNHPVILNVQTLPTSHGYQDVLAELHHVRAHTFFQPSLWRAPADRGAKGGLMLVPNTRESLLQFENVPEEPTRVNDASYPEVAYCDDAYALAALRFVRRQAREYRETGRPFFGLLAVQVPHAPFAEVSRLPEWDAAYREDPHFSALPDQARQWAAMVTRLDAHFGNLLQALEDPNGDGDTTDSIANDTLVIFQSDNGGPQHAARKAFAANGGLRGAKGQIYEGGIRVPTLVWWPGTITADSRLRAGTSVDRVLDVSDWLPTFCELAGVTAPLGIDGVSVAPLLRGDGVPRQRDYLIHEAGRGQSILRGTDKLVRTRSGWELYDLSTDPAESTNRIEAAPELAAELKASLLGEHVAEPKGFANTYHHWIGESGGDLADEGNWSDYIYANEGIAYLLEGGAPRDSWIAHLRVPQGQSVAGALTVGVTRDTTFLGLGIGGSEGRTSEVRVTVPVGVTLGGRNEIRLGRGGRLVLVGGAVESLRWVELLPGSRLEGGGEVRASVYSGGHVAVQGRALGIRGGYVETEGARLQLGVTKPVQASLVAEGPITVAGRLEIALKAAERLESKTVIPLLRGERLSGRFSGWTVNGTAGAESRFRLVYRDQGVDLVVR